MKHVHENLFAMGTSSHMSSGVSYQIGSILGKSQSLVAFIFQKSSQN